MKRLRVAKRLHQTPANHRTPSLQEPNSRANHRLVLLLYLDDKPPHLQLRRPKPVPAWHNPWQDIAALVLICTKHTILSRHPPNVAFGQPPKRPDQLAIDEVAVSTTVLVGQEGMSWQNSLYLALRILLDQSQVPDHCQMLDSRSSQNNNSTDPFSPTFRESGCSPSLRSESARC